MVCTYSKITIKTLEMNIFIVPIKAEFFVAEIYTESIDLVLLTKLITEFYMQWSVMK